MFLKRKGQVSVEFLLVFSIGFILLISLSGIFFNYLTYSKNSVDNKFIEKVGEELISNIEKVYFLGVGNMVTLEVNMPDNIVNFSIYHVVNSSVNGKNVSFDYLNITYLNCDEFSSIILEASEPYIRFSCEDCKNVSINSNLSASYYDDDSVFNGENKRIKVRSLGGMVLIKFIR